MLDYKAVEKNIDFFASRLKRRGFAFDTAEFARLSENRKRLIQEESELRAELNRASKDIGRLIGERGKDSPEVAAAKTEVETLKERLNANKIGKDKAEDDFTAFMLLVPNVLSEKTPDGADESANVEVSRHNPMPEFDFEPKDHIAVGEALGIFDFERAAKLSGARFAIIRGPGVALERAIANFLLDHAIGRGYEQISVPYMVKREIMTGTGQLPKFEEDLFRIVHGDREWFLIPTAEVPVTNIYADEIIDEKNLPRKFCCLTACFRAEAGSHGKDVKGIIRQHQFHKVELVHFATEENSWDEYAKLLASAQSCLDTLGLHYRTMKLCAGDVGFSAAFCCDLEVWLPGQNAFREISSCSNFGDYQARRAKIRTKIGGKTQFVHTMNGSGMPIGRTMVAVLEQRQRADGSVVIPEALRKYTGFSTMLPGGGTE